MGRFVRCLVLALVVWSCAFSAGWASPFERPASAQRELVGERTASSRTWELPSGRRVTQLAAGPVQWRDRQGVWHEYDLALRASGGGWVAQAGRVSIELPGKLSATGNGAVEVADGAGNGLSMSFVGEAADGALSGDGAVYRDVAEGVDLRLRAIPDGLKEDVVLEGPDASRELSYRLAVDEGLAVLEDGRGGLRVVRGEEVVFVIPAPTLVDDAGVPGPTGRFEARRESDGTWLISTVLSQRWLDANERAWPVVVDPSVLTFRAPGTDACVVSQAISGTDLFDPVYSCNNGSSARVGKAPFSGGWENDSWLLRFDTLTLVSSDVIDGASLSLYRTANDPTFGSMPVGVYRVRTQWSGSPLPTMWPGAIADPVQVAELPAGTTGVRVDADVTNIVTQWRRFSQTGGLSGVPNYGLYFSGTSRRGGEQQLGEDEGGGDWYTRTCGVRGFECPNTSFGSPSNSDSAKRPILEVTSWPAAADGNAVISPEEGELTGRRVPLQARALSNSVRSVRFQYIAGSQSRWTDIPLAALETPSRAAVGSQDIAASGPSGDRRSDLVVWDLSATPGGDVDGPVHVRAWLESATPGQGGMTDEINFRLDRRGIDGAPSVPIGPGEVNLLSGEFTMSETDVSVEAFVESLTLARTYRSRGVAVRNADMFGPGWEASVAADGGELPYKAIYNYSEVRDEVVDRQVLDPSRWNWELFFETFDVEDLLGDLESMQETERFNYEYAVVEAGDGEKMTFTQVKNSRGEVTDWTPDDLHPGFRLARTSTGTRGVFEITLTDPSGTVATFRSEAANSPSYRLTQVQQPGSSSGLSYTYEAAGERRRIRSVTAPNPTGGTPRSLVFTWSDVGAARTPRVTSVAFKDGTSTAIPVATYFYDSDARLIKEEDPRVDGGGVRRISYHYNAGGQLDIAGHSGQESWNLTYTRIAGDSGPRLASVSRDHPDGGTATQTVRYDVPVSGSGAPHDMSIAETAKWDQEDADDVPWDAVAVWPADTIPDPEEPDYSKATIYYVGVHGLQVNEARPDGAISTTWRDANGNVERGLDAVGREVALAAGASSEQVAVDRSTFYGYTGGGVVLESTREPITQITLSDGRVVTGRRITTTNYDENAPRGGPYYLPTSRWRAVETGGSQVDVRELVRYTYEAEGGMSGWSARHATKTVVDPGGRALTSYSILHGTYPLVEETRTAGMPGGGSSPDVQWHQYYGITPTRVPAGIQDSQCRSFAANASGRLCMRSENTTGTAAVQRRWYTYSTYGHVATLNESRTLTQSGSTFRSTAYTYDGADQLTSEAMSGGSGVATPTTTHAYGPETGLLTETRSSTGTITRVFDSNGRLASYTDASGTVSTHRYDLRGRESTLTVEGVTTRFGYDDRDNRTTVDDPGVGSAITGTYDLDDRLVGETLPNGLVSMQTYDETGRPSLLSWTQTSGCSRDCVWASSAITNRDADGRTVGQLTNDTQEALAYDTAGRLAQSDAVRLSDNRCVRRTYAYDDGRAGDSNRTTGTVRTGAPGGACGTGSLTTRPLTYDNADRITSSGWVWDDFGRATTVPLIDNGGRGNLTASYYTNDYVASLQQGRIHSYQRDALQRTQRIASSGASKPATSLYYRYSDDSDRPTRITQVNDVTRDVEGPGGNIVASVVNGRATYQLRDIQGSIVANAPANGPLSASTEYDPFGIVTTLTPNVIDWTDGLPANGWLGTYQRPTQFGQTYPEYSGPIEMGTRVYLPRIGRFLQRDPVDGGSLNAYDYANQDPVNAMDLSGEFSIGGVIQVVAGGLSIAVGVTTQVVCSAGTIAVGDVLGPFHCYTAAGIPITGGAILFSNGMNDLLGKHKKFRATIRVVRRISRNQCSIGDYNRITARAVPRR